MTWNDRLISHAEASQLAGAEQLAWIPAETGMVLRHLPCGKSCGLWALGQPTSADEVLAGVLRHLVTHHDLPLNRAERERRKADERTAGDQPAGHPSDRDRTPEAVGDASPGPGPGPAPGSAAPGKAGRRVRRAARETGGDRA